jgi:hypothetical protein
MSLGYVGLALITNHCQLRKPGCMMLNVLFPVDKVQEAMRFIAMSMPWQYFIQAELKVSDSFFSIRSMA